MKEMEQLVSEKTQQLERLVNEIDKKGTELVELGSKKEELEREVEKLKNFEADGLRMTSGQGEEERMNGIMDVLDSLQAELRDKN